MKPFSKVPRRRSGWDGSGDIVGGGEKERPALTDGSTVDDMRNPDIEEGRKIDVGADVDEE